MPNIQIISADSKNFKEFAKNYFNYLNEILEALDCNSIDAFMNELENARINNRSIFIIGNGGSASTASHIANDLGMISRKFNFEPSFRALSLTDNVSIMTALGNDYGYQDIFLDQIKIHYREGDILIVISASGNSPNVVLTAEWVKQKKGKILGLLGFDGGKLKNLCDISIIAETPKGEYGPVEDVHMIMDHLITTWFHLKYNK
jgi:D-sedoheptulose 7-phosphate isomerase